MNIVYSSKNVSQEKEFVDYTFLMDYADYLGQIDFLPTLAEMKSLSKDHPRAGEYSLP